MAYSLPDKCITPSRSASFFLSVALAEWLALILKVGPAHRCAVLMLRAGTIFGTGHRGMQRSEGYSCSRAQAWVWLCCCHLSVTYQWRWNIFLAAAACQQMDCCPQLCITHATSLYMLAWDLHGINEPASALSICPFIAGLVSMYMILHKFIIIKGTIH